MMRKQFLVGSLLLVVGVLSGLVLQPLFSKDNVYDLLEKYKYVFNTAFRNYVDKVDPSTLTEAAVKGMLNELDPHSVYISADEMKSVNEDMQGSFDGIGVEFDILSDTLTVITPIAGGPSEEKGILAGDKIVKIDGENAVGIQRSQVPKKLRGPKGTKVELDIFRNGNPNLLHFSIVRDKIPFFSVDASYVIPGTDIGVIAVNRFAQTTHKEMMEAAQKLKSLGMKKLILDLRGNPGGYLQQAFAMADEFLPNQGDTIVYTKGRYEEFDEVYTSSPGNALEDIPLIVMINAGSASASEIVSGAIQDLDRGLIVGTTSFGKGLVQRQYDIPDGSAFRLTISRYYTPSGRSIQRPYKDKAGYRSLLGRLELEEGSNMDHALETIKKNLAKDNEGKSKEDIVNLDSIPIYKTRGGRTVLGGGGITPDYIIKSDTITDFSIQLRMKGLFNEYVNNILGSGKKIKEKYNGDFNKFFKEFDLTESDLAEFKKLAETKGVKWNDTEYEIDKDYIKTAIKAVIANINWDRSAQSVIFTKVDKQLQKAMNLFSEAQKIAKNHKKK